MEKKKRLFLLLLLLGLTTSLLAYKLLSSPSIEIIEFTNGKIVESPYPFYYQDTEHPKAKALRAKVEPAIAGISNEWEQLIAIRKWVRSQWEHGEPQFRTWDALILLNLAGKGNRFWCSQYSIVYVQCCAVLDLPARHIELYNKNLNSHATTEVWSNDYNKWIVMDVDYNCYYTKDDIPLSALEIHNAWLNSETDLIKIERAGTTTMPNPYDAHKSLMIFYNHLGYIFRNDFLTLEIEGAIPTHKIPGCHPQWVDDQTPPLSFYSQKTNQTSDIYYTLNQVEIDLSYRKSFHPKERFVKVQLTHNMPNFDKYLIRINQARDWEEGISPFMWQMQKGLNTLEVKARNKAGVDGPISRVILRLD